ncbi:MAG: hypothetical protein RLY58_1297 [Pseudomonadota bacterium]
MHLGFYPAKILSYNAAARTAQISIAGITDGAEDGLKATFAYPVGDDDKDTEREILPGADVYVFFEQSDTGCPVIAFYRSHGEGALKDVRRIRQKQIELIAENSALIEAITTKVVGAMRVTGNLSVGTGATGTFVSVTGQIITVTDGIITNIF